MRKIFITGLMAFFLFSCGNEEIKTPSQKRGFTTPSTHEEIISFMVKIDKEFDFARSYELGKNNLGQSIAGVKLSNGVFGEDPDKLRILVFAQQHGNEQSGMEGTLLWLAKFVSKTDQTLLQKADIFVIPQVNPYGGIKNQRRNPNDFDLNRNHMLLDQPETKALHSLFHKYNFDVTIDMHEYWPYGEDWKEFGAYKNFDMQIGTLTNPNTFEKLKDYALNNVFPYLDKELKKQNLSFFNYLVGPAPQIGYSRHSTADINDGRQSFGILNTLSFIFEGLNGMDRYSDNLQKRAYAQYTALNLLLNKIYRDDSFVKEILKEGKNKLLNPEPNEKVAIRIEHVNKGEVLEFPLVTTQERKDTIVFLENYHPNVISTLDVEKPKGYLVPDTLTGLINLLKLHNIDLFKAGEQETSNVNGYWIQQITKSIDEGLENLFPTVLSRNIKVNPEKFYFVPTSQIAGNKIVIMLEPQSMYGIVNTTTFSHLLQPGELYPVLRVEWENLPPATETK
ncbi:MAG: M14 family zinc carboxypeptidase [Bacteroidota bacterium]